MMLLSSTSHFEQSVAPILGMWSGPGQLPALRRGMTMFGLFLEAYRGDKQRVVPGIIS
jgi:hypothetical protein